MITTVRDTAEWLAIFDNTLQAHSDVDRFKKALDREHPATAPVVESTCRRTSEGLDANTVPCNHEEHRS